MLNLKKYSPFADYRDTGFGSNDKAQGTRFMDSEGNFNVFRTGLPWWKRISLYQWLLDMPWWKFHIVITLYFAGLNLFFVALYFWAGLDHFVGLFAETDTERFMEVLFFSIQTFTTVGYGRVNPLGTPSGIIASIEALTGVLTVAVATGLLFAKFSRPMTKLIFSKQALCNKTGTDNKEALMFRFANSRDNQITDVSVQVILALDVVAKDDGVTSWKYYNLELERSRINFLPLSWTVVHYIDENSPLYNFTKQDVENANAEILILIALFDDTFAQTVHIRHSYKFDEWVWGESFLPMFKPASHKRHYTHLELDKISDITQNKV
jgi:inward rectifier potassium channel